MIKKRNNGIGPPGYHEHYYGDRDWQAYSELLSRVVRYSMPGPILDLGAGCGYFVEAAGRWGFQSVGLEGSPEAVEMAKKRMAGLDIRLHSLGDFFPFQDGHFQTVVLNQVIEHLEPEVMHHVLCEAKRVLRPAGMLMITSPSCYNTFELKADPTHINLLSPSQLRNALAETGYENVASFDSQLNLLGNGWLAKGIMFVVFKALKIDLFSATANAIAYKKSQ